MADINAQVARMHAAIAAGLPADRPGVPQPAAMPVDVHAAILAELRAVRKLLERHEAARIADERTAARATDWLAANLRRTVDRLSPASPAVTPSDLGAPLNSSARPSGLEGTEQTQPSVAAEDFR